MTNAEALSDGLQKIYDYEVAVCVVDYINCPSSDDCTYDGRDNSPCDECKLKWLESEFTG